jgi:hypothetical protein
MRVMSGRAGGSACVALVYGVRPSRTYTLEDQELGLVQRRKSKIEDGSREGTVNLPIAPILTNEGHMQICDEGEAGGANERDQEPPTDGLPQK